ncbi:hypothetical protein CEXT_192501 [Caerostris extrusa]|uniref:Uncharacterized protein n=1 Tax=Caerostris extrusa TaxID=172846 RepID=A0AAV4X868_CAEEX|nr:hypothetical protein CEXT_192501 [Caerostris extrusa]
MLMYFIGMDALHWIKKEGPWKTFVENRVKEIRKLSEIVIIRQAMRSHYTVPPHRKGELQNASEIVHSSRRRFDLSRWASFNCPGTYETFALDGSPISTEGHETWQMFI